MKITTRRGWIELEDVRKNIVDGFDIHDVWRAAGQGDADRALREIAEFWDFDDEPCGVRVISEPDDIIGEIYRIWIKTECER